MDPVTAALDVAKSLIDLQALIFKAAPADLQAKVAGDSLTFLHNIGSFVLTLQDKINAAVGVKPAA